MVQLIFILILIALVITYWYVLLVFLAAIMGVCVVGKVGASLIRYYTPKISTYSIDRHHHRTVMEPKMSKPPIVKTPPIPDLGLPLFWILWTAGWAIFWLIMTVATLEISYTVWVAFSIISFLPSYFWYQKRIKARAEWRKQRHVDWLFKEPLKAPVITDWEEYERTLKVKF
jgi:hypothetical protein